MVGVVTAYLQTQDDEVLSADPVDLVRLLLDAALNGVHDARAALVRDCPASRSRHVSRVQAILAELACSLDHERGGSLSRNLAELYDYLQRLLLKAHAGASDEPLAEASRLLATLRAAW